MRDLGLGDANQVTMELNGPSNFCICHKHRVTELSMEASLPAVSTRFQSPRWSLLSIVTTQGGKYSRRPQAVVLHCSATVPHRSDLAIDDIRKLAIISVVIGRLKDESYQVKNKRWRPVFVLETGGSPSPDDQDFEDDSGFLGRTRLGRLIQATGRKLVQKLNSARTNSPTKIFLVLLGFYTANALATILGQTGDWDVLVAGLVVAAIEGIGMLMYRKTFDRLPGRFQSFIALVNYWKAGVCLGLFVDAFKLGS